MKKILANLMKVADELEKTAIDYNEYKKLHPRTKKTPSDPLFKNKSQPDKTIEEINGRFTCTKCGKEWSAMMGDDEIPETCECQI